ncbi:site-specific integrase [Streptomyces galilaeus]|uniref:hypothetical protein n=1 Tax=Streptomyces galilaeus TaxID=33899 RepID=UPI0038F7FC1A
MNAPKAPARPPRRAARPSGASPPDLCPLPPHPTGPRALSPTNHGPKRLQHADHGVVLHYGCSSLRRGFATAARAAGHDPLEITRAGGWVDGSHLLARYMNDVDRVKNSPLLGIGL